MPVTRMTPGTAWKARGNRPIQLSVYITIRVAVTLSGYPDTWTMEERLTRKVGLDKGASVSKPLGNQESPTQHPLQQAGQDTTVFSLRQLRGVHGNRRGDHADGGTADEAANDQHDHVDGAGLQSGAEARNHRPDEDGVSPTDLVGKEHVDDGAEDGTALKG